MKLLVTTVIIAVLLGCGYHRFYQLTRPLPLPHFDINKYWGPGDGAHYKEDKSIKPFKVKRSAEEIADLHKQLNRTLKLAAPLEGIKFEYGFNTEATAQIVKYWLHDYLPRWSERETYLNSFPQFTTQIQGLRIHYIHAKPGAAAVKSKKVLPLLLLHGWPGSVREFYDFIPLLTKPDDKTEYVYEVIAPSLVGYGWSEAATKPGFNAAEMAIVMRNLMLRLGHEKFLVQGGDWGSIIGGHLATIFPDNVLGFHSNMCVLHTKLSVIKSVIANLMPERFVPSKDFVGHHFPLSEKIEFMLRETGYFHIQATKPDTIGTVLQQNPIGLAAYILEKFQLTTSPACNQEFDCIAKTYTLDAVLDNIMIYYLSNTATTAVRFYAENSSRNLWALQLERVQSPVPMGCVRFRYDVTPVTDWQLKDKFPNLIHSRYFNERGHFAALEVPEMLYSDFVEFVAKIDFKE